MSVIVKGMEMPSDCLACDFADDEARFCKVAKEYIPMLAAPKFCPLRPLPEKHGRLIDAKDLEKMRFTDGINGEDCKLYVPFVEVAEAIFKCPTIVESEGD